MSKHVLMKMYVYTVPELISITEGILCKLNNLTEEQSKLANPQKVYHAAEFLKEAEECIDELQI